QPRHPAEGHSSMGPLSRRTFLGFGLAASAGMALAAEPPPANVHDQLLDLAARHEERRRARVPAGKTNAGLAALQDRLRGTFLGLLGGLPDVQGPPPARVTGTIEADGYRIEKLAFESAPGYLVPALLYLPKAAGGPLPGVVSPCGHSAVGKAAPAYQTLHVNLAKRGFVVLTYDPVGQGERSQFWDTRRGRSRFNLA